jgi:hypothetical protein
MGVLGELETAAVLWGAVADGVFSGLTVLPSNEISAQDEFTANLRSDLGETRYVRATARGAAMTDEESTAFVLSAIETLRRNQRDSIPGYRWRTKSGGDAATEHT